MRVRGEIIKAKKQLASGLDPGVQRKLERLAATVASKNTFRAVADEWLEKLVREGRAVATLNKTKWLLDQAHTMVGERPIAEIDPPELLSVLRKVEARDRLQRDRRDRRRVPAAPRIGGNIGQLEELPPCVRPTQRRRDWPRQTGRRVKLVIPVIGIGLQNPGEVAKMPVFSAADTFNCRAAFSTASASFARFDGADITMVGALAILA
jgi:integrase